MFIVYYFDDEMNECVIGVANSNDEDDVKQYINMLNIEEEKAIIITDKIRKESYK